MKIHDFLLMLFMCILVILVCGLVNGSSKEKVIKRSRMRKRMTKSLGHSLFANIPYDHSP